MTTSLSPAADTGGTAPFHALDADEVLRRLQTTPDGLSADEAARRLRLHGPNRLTPRRKKHWLLRLLSHFHNVLIYVLLAASVGTFVLGKYVDTGIILAVVVINALIGFLQEGRAEKALDAIRGMLSLDATVLRGGKRQMLPAEQLVPGDVVVLRAGDKVPADLRLLDARDLRIEEAMLTGESVPAEKDPAPLPEDTPLGDRACLAFSGTLVTTGSGLGVVVATGDRTELGRISELVSETAGVTTPLIAQMNRFGNLLAVVILSVAALTFVAGYLNPGDNTLVDLFLAAVSLAVAAIPEGLPAILTIVLAIGVQRMARRHAIIRKLPAVDTLGALTVICSDKTGTLTRNEMTVTAVVTPSARYTVTGVGYAPVGEIRRDDRQADVREGSALFHLLRAAVLCNDSDLRIVGGEHRPEGDPMESALLTLAEKAKIDHHALRKQLPTRDVIPFDSRHRYMATAHDADDGRLVYLKGGPERVLEMCQHQLLDDGTTAPLDVHAVQQAAEQLATEGMRVLAFALRHLPEGQGLTHDAVASGMTLLGLVGIIDPPREEAIDAVARCHDAGIRVVMITGDHATTARAIGKALAIGDGTTSLTGSDLDRLDDRAMVAAARDCDVFARVSPEHKLKLVQAIQADGQVVAMTGDGVNDAPALKRADVGIAMGIKGTEVTKEAAEMVLADDNFASIAHAVEEGRAVYDNLRKCVLFILPTNGGQGFTVFVAILFGWTLPLTPVQVLWVNLVTAVTLALALAFEKPEPDVMKRPPRDPKAQLLSAYFLWRIALVSLLMAAGTFGMFTWALRSGHDLQTARTLAVNTMVGFEIFYLFAARFITAPALSVNGLFGSRPVLLSIALIVALQLLFTYAPPAQAVFGTTGLSAGQWAVILVLSSTALFVVEAEKAVVRRLGRRV
ncbi:MAG: cation-transporting P-type ATPase [Tepidisphaerales bacterium]